MDVRLCHAACHVKSRCMSPSAMNEAPATQNDLACNQGGCHQVPRLPRKTTVAVSSCHACHVISRWMSPSATPATQSGAAPRRQSRTKRATQYHTCHACHAKRRWRYQGGCHQVPRLPRKVARRPGDRARPSVPPSTISATPATQNDGGCEFVPRLPRDIKVDVTKCHTCHAKWRGAQATKPDQARHPVP